VVSVMDRLKQLYFEKIRPLEEAYAFGEFYSCVARARPTLFACRAERRRCRHAVAAAVASRLCCSPLAGRCTRRRTLTPSRWSCCESSVARARARARAARCRGPLRA